MYDNTNLFEQYMTFSAVCFVGGSRRTIRYSIEQVGGGGGMRAAGSEETECGTLLFEALDCGRKSLEVVHSQVRLFGGCYRLM